MTATVTAFIGTANFVALLGPIMADLETRSPSKGSRKLSKNFSGSQLSDAAPGPTKYLPRVDRLEVAKPLGAGAFARVNMVRDASTRRLALKGSGASAVHLRA